MARNRKSQSAAIRFGPALKAVLLCVLIGGSGVGYVWQKDQIDRLGRQIKARENRLRALEEQNDKLARGLATMRSPQVLERRLKELNLGLVPPDPAQIWRLIEPMPEPAGPSHARQYAAQSARPTGPQEK
jgi:hypothetical protein